MSKQHIYLWDDYSKSFHINTEGIRRLSSKNEYLLIYTGDSAEWFNSLQESFTNKTGTIVKVIWYPWLLGWDNVKVLRSTLRHMFPKASVAIGKTFQGYQIIKLDNI